MENEPEKSFQFSLKWLFIAMSVACLDAWLTLWLSLGSVVILNVIGFFALDQKNRVSIALILLAMFGPWLLVIPQMDTMTSCFFELPGWFVTEILTFNEPGEEMGSVVSSGVTLAIFLVSLFITKDGNCMRAMITVLNLVYSLVSVFLFYWLSTM